MDKRPFVDRRLAFVVLFRGAEQNLTDAEVFDAAELASRDFSINVRRVSTNDSPPQAKVIMSESSAKPTTLQTIARKLSDELDNKGRGVQTIEVVSEALSPGDKVRNAMGV